MMIMMMLMLMMMMMLMLIMMIQELLVQYHCYSFLFMMEIATSPFGKSKGVPFGKLWEDQYHCFSFLMEEIATSLLEALGGPISWFFFSVHHGNSYFTFLGIKGRRPGEYPGGFFFFMKEIVILPFRGQREYLFGRSNIFLFFPALFMMEIATSPFGKSKGVPFGKLWVV